MEPEKRTEHYRSELDMVMNTHYQIVFHLFDELVQDERYMLEEYSEELVQWRE